MVTVFQVAHDILYIKHEDEEDIKEGGKAGKEKEGEEKQEGGDDDKNSSRGRVRRKR